ncbi:uncharacterized protein [Miscanthus floridulus]
MTRLLDAVTKLKQDVSSSIKSPIITGCSLFLQVLYLDSIDPDVLSMKHNSFPRIRDFSYDRMRLMIAAEQNCARGNDNTRDCKIRDAVDCRYHWAAQPERDGSRSGCLLAIWESSVAMAHLLKIPMEAAGSLFIAAADFQDQINSGLRVSEPIEFMSVLVSIMLPYTNGFNYQFSIDDDDNKAAEAGLAKFPSTLSNGL